MTSCEDAFAAKGVVVPFWRAFMSSESDESQELKFNLPFLKVDAKGNNAIQAVNRPLLIIASALAATMIIIALNYSHPEWQAFVTRPLAWLKNLV
jgi:hypothetical protein